MNNKITLAGIVNSTLEYSHEVFGEKFFEFVISVDRQSGKKDELLCLISEVNANLIEPGEEITIIGEVRNRNYTGEDEKRHNKIYVFVKEVLPYDGKDRNEVEMNGFICKEPSYRITPLGRQISDFLLAINRRSHNSDYIPCICWGRNALRMSNAHIGENVIVNGRLQSREYVKRYEDGTEETKTAYELSINSYKEVHNDGE